MQAAVMRGVKKMGGFPRIAANGRLIGLRLPGLDGKGGVSAAYMSEMVGALHRLYVFNAGLLMQQAERAQHLKSIDEGVEARFAALERAGKAVAEGREASKAAERMVARECQPVYQHVDQLHSALSMLLSGEVVATNEDRPPSDPVDGSMSGIFHAPLHNCVPTHASGSTAQPSPAHLHKSVPTQGSGSTPELSPAPLHNSVPTQASHSTPKLSPAPLHNSVPTQASYLLHVAMDTASFLIAALLSPEGFVGPDRTWHEPQEDTAGGGSYLEGGGGRAAMPWGAAGGMGREGAMPWESAGGLGREGAMPWESAGGLGRQGAMPWESAGGMGRGSAGPWESAGGLGRGSEMLWDAPGEPLLLSRQESQQGWQASGSPSLQLRDLGPTPPAPLPSPRSSSPGWLDLAVSHEQAGAINLPNGEDLICLSQSMMQRSEHFPKRPYTARAYVECVMMRSQEQQMQSQLWQEGRQTAYTAYTHGTAYVERVMMRSQEQQMQSQLWQEGKPPGSHRNLPQTSQPSRSGRMMDDGREGSSRETPRGPVGGSAPPAPAPVFRPMLQPSVRVDANGRRMYGWYTKKALLPKIDAALTTRPVSKDKLRPIGEGLSRPATAEQQPQGLGAAPVEQQLEGGRGGNASYENVYREIGRPNEEGEGVGEGESLSLLLNPEQMQTSEEGVLHYSDKSVLQTSDKGVLQSNDEGVLQTSDKGVLQSSDEGGLKCKLFGTARNLDASYISIEVVNRSGSGLPRFRKTATEALEAAMRAHSSWPAHMKSTLKQQMQTMCMARQMPRMSYFHSIKKRDSMDLALSSTLYEGYQDGNAYLCADQVGGGFPEHGDNDFEESKAPTDKDSTDEEYEDGINQDDDGTSIDNDDTLYRQQQQQQQSPQDHHYPLPNGA
eukprot:gene15646-21753_t